MFTDGWKCDNKVPAGAVRGPLEFNFWLLDTTLALTEINRAIILGISPLEILFVSLYDFGHFSGMSRNPPLGYNGNIK